MGCAPLHYRQAWDDTICTAGVGLMKQSSTALQQTMNVDLERALCGILLPPTPASSTNSTTTTIAQQEQYCVMMTNQPWALTAATRLSSRRALWLMEMMCLDKQQALTRATGPPGWGMHTIWYLLRQGGGGARVELGLQDHQTLLLLLLT